MSVANTIDPKGRTSTVRHKCCKLHPWNGHEMGFFWKAKIGFIKESEWYSNPNAGYKRFPQAIVRKGRDQDFSDLNPKMMEVIFFLKGQDRIHQREQVVFQSRSMLQTISASYCPKGNEPRFLKSELKSDGRLFFCFEEIFFKRNFFFFEDFFLNFF